MPNPTVGSVHINQPLSDVSIAYVQDDTERIFHRVAPFVRTRKKSNKYYIYDKHSLLRNDARRRDDGAQSAKSEFKLSNDNFDCEVTAVHIDLGPQAMANQDDEALDLEESTSEIVADKLLIAQEADFASVAFKTGVWSGMADYIGGTTGPKWTDFAGSNPLAVVRAIRTAIKKSTGRKPNKGILGYETFEVLKSHPVIKEQIKYTSAKTLTVEMFAEMLEIEELLIAEAIQATSAPGATEAYDFSLAGDCAWFGYVAKKPGKMQPSAMYTFAWDALPGGSVGETIQIGREIVPLTGGAVRIEAQAGWQTKITGADLGAFVSDIV